MGVGVAGLSIARQADARLPAQTQPGRTGTPSGEQVGVRHLWTTSEYVGLGTSSVSADGRYLAFADFSTGDLAVHDFASGKNRRVTIKGSWSKSAEYAYGFMRFSPDGRQIAYTWDRAESLELRIINQDGSRSRLVHRHMGSATTLAAHDWSSDGKYIAAVLPKTGATVADPRTALQIALIRVTDGSVRTLREFIGPQPVAMSFSPDGRFLSYDLPATGASEKRDVFVLRIDDGRETTVVGHPADDRLLRWMPDGGALLFTSDRTGSLSVWLQPLKDGRPQGAAQRVNDNMGECIQPLGFTRDGAYYCASSNAGRNEVYAASLDLEKGLVTDSPAPAPHTLGSNEGPDWSPDGKSLAYIHRGTSIVIRTLETGEERTLSPKTVRVFVTQGWGERYLRWSPDGGTLLAPQGGGGLALVDVKTGEATSIVTGRRTHYGRWSRDGQTIFYARLGEGTSGVGQIMRWNLQTQREEALYRPESPAGVG